MPHITRVVKWEQLSNGQFAFTLRVDGDATSDYTHTLDSSIAADPAQRTASLEAAKSTAEGLYDKALLAESAGVNLAGTQI